MFSVHLSLSAVLPLSFLLLGAGLESQFVAICCVGNMSIIPNAYCASWVESDCVHMTFYSSALRVLSAQRATDSVWWYCLCVTRSPHCILSHILRACPDGLVLIAVYGSAAELQDLFPRYVVRCRRAGKREVDAIGNYTWALPPCWSYNDAIACYSDCIFFCFLTG